MQVFDLRSACVSFNHQLALTCEFAWPGLHRLQPVISKEHIFSSNKVRTGIFFHSPCFIQKAFLFEMQMHSKGIPSELMLDASHQFHNTPANFLLLFLFFFYFLHTFSRYMCKFPIASFTIPCRILCTDSEATSTAV